MSICEHRYNQFKNVLSGCKTSEDAYFFADLYTRNNPTMRLIVYSMVGGKTFGDGPDFRKIIDIINALVASKTETDAHKTLDSFGDSGLRRNKLFRQIIESKPEV